MTQWDLSAPEREPLDPEEREVVVAEAGDARLVTRFAVFGILYAGVSSRELAHLRAEMVRSTGEQQIRLVLQGSVKCRAGGGEYRGIGWMPDPEIDLSAGCSDCDGVYDSFRPRTVPVREPNAVSAIQTMLSVHDASPSSSLLRSRIGRLGERCGVERLTSSVLYYTYPVVLAEHGFTRDEIAEVMGYTESKREDINFSGQVGPYCRGENPFICSAECNDGSICERPADTGRDYCSRHVPEAVKCGALLSDGSRCELLVSGPYETCHHHSSSGDVFNRCGVVKDDGGRCRALVGEPDETCHWHS